ncbi:hypothetical protein ACSMX9_22690 [Streptomyces sp. LE64]|uniref:hypothetical protein n=1 Tax=Streptomyces sp. LE64 TaxID=3448653 RepID=UPI004041C03F
MARIPDAVAVASLDTHRLMLTIQNDGLVHISSNLSPDDAAALLRKIARSCEDRAGFTDQTSAPGALDAATVREALDFNAADPDPALTTLRDVVLDRGLTRTPAQALAAARIILEAHTRQLAALIAAEHDRAEAAHGLSRSTRGLLTGYSSARRALDRHADALAREQDTAEQIESDR